MEVATITNGRNMPEDPAEAIREDLAERYDDLRYRQEQLLDAAGRAPEIIADEETAAKVGDFIKQLSACMKNSEAARVKEKEPHLACGRMVDGFFKNLSDPLEKAKRQIEARLTAFLREKEAKARREREEAERIAREQAQAAARAAAEAEAAMKTADDLESTIAAAAVAQKAQADAEAAHKAASVNAAELSRSRGDLGSVASLRTFWDFADLDRAALDLETLRPHLPTDALEKAIRSFIKAGGRQLRGARIYENTAATVR